MIATIACSAVLSIYLIHRARSPSALRIFCDLEKQGSEQATFLLCPKCQTVVGVCYIDGVVFVASLNARLLDEFEHLQGSIAISPKQLDKTQKTERWRNLWSQLRVVKG